MEFQFRNVSIPTSDPVYDLVQAGSIKPREVLVQDQQVDEVEAAVELIQEFLRQAEEGGILEIC